MSTYKLIMCPPNMDVRCICKTAQAISKVEFAKICDNDPYLNELFNKGWTIAGIKVVKK